MKAKAIRFIGFTHSAKKAQKHKEKKIDTFRRIPSP